MDSLEAQKLKRTEWSACRNPVWLTRYVHQTWKIGKGISLFKIDNDFAVRLLSLAGNGKGHQLALDELARIF